MENKVFVLSDIHLEGKSEIAQEFMLKTINKLLSQQKSNNINPILVLAGDVHNGIKGFPWMEKINSPIVYLCGNHEFWESDYNEVLKNLSENTPANVTFLHNDFVQIEGYIFVGGTMWTDLGKSFNPDLFSQTTYVMNDAVRITNKSWYQHPDNLEKLHASYADHIVERMIEGNEWNTLMEVEENAKTINFFNDFGQVMNLLKEIPKQLESLKRQLTTSYKPITQEEFETKEEVLLSYKNLDLFTWLEQCKSHELGDLYDWEKVFNQKNINYNNIFNKLKLMNVHLPLIAVSHHLPFLEERLIGRQDWSRNANPNLINPIREDIYNIHYGLDYPDYNYFWRISKGEYKRDDSITEAVHYCNNGVGNISSKFLENVSAWLHGHDHHYNYQDFLKSIPIVTNPMGYSMAVFVIKDGKISLGSPYKNHHEVKDEDEEKEIEEITETFIRPVNIQYKNDSEKKDIVKLWVLKNFKLDNYIEANDVLAEMNKKLLNYILRRPKLAIGEFTPKEHMEIQILANAIDFNFNVVKDLEKNLQHAVAVRLDEKFSYMNKKNDMVDSCNILEMLKEPMSFGIGGTKELRKIANYANFENDSDFLYDHLIDITFYNTVLLKENVKKINKLKKSLSEISIGYIQDIQVDDTKKVFDKKSKVYKNYKEEQKIYDKLEEKKTSLIKKYRTEEISEELKKRHKSRFDF
jgi:predicted phosphohydrolase